LEYLEERTLLDAAGPMPGLVSTGTSSQSATSSFLAQGELASQFRVFGVNSQGAGFQLSQLQSQLNFQFGAFGFGSGTQPNAPWALKAYNLGLANQQFNSSLQSDFGSQQAPPWTVPVAQAQQSEQPAPENKETLPTPEKTLAPKPVDEQEQSQQDWIDQSSDKNDEWKRLWEKSASDKKHLADEALLQQDSSIPDALWLSALAPAPMAALVAGLPGMAFESEGDGGGAEAAE
jgi:hypothetical protein